MDSIAVGPKWLAARDLFVDRLREYRLPLGGLAKGEIAQRSCAFIEATVESLCAEGIDRKDAEFTARYRVCAILLDQFTDKDGFDLYCKSLQLTLADSSEPPKGKPARLNRGSPAARLQRREARELKWLPVIKAKRLTLSQWATRAGVSPSIVYDYLSGKTFELHEDTRDSLSGVLKVPPSELMDDIVPDSVPLTETETSK